MLKVNQESDWPHGIEYQITTVQSESIWGNLNNVFNNAWQAMLGVFLVLLVVLTWREAIIVGLVLALGLLVDVFILMMEGMHEAIFTHKKTFNEAAIATVKTYAMPAFAGQMTTILAMAPLLAVGGVAGKFIQLVPLTTIVALIMSFLVALLITISSCQCKK